MLLLGLCACRKQNIISLGFIILFLSSAGYIVQLKGYNSVWFLPSEDQTTTNNLCNLLALYHWT